MGGGSGLGVVRRQTWLRAYAVGPLRSRRDGLDLARSEAWRGGLGKEFLRWRN
jgi:hypothetical protein